MRFLKAIWRMLRSNLLLKIMAALFAIILWSYVLAETNPPRERIMKDIAVRYENMEELKEKELDISGSLSEVLNSVDIRVEVRQGDLKYLSDENVRAYIDLSVINGKGEHTVKIIAQTTYGEVLEISPSEVTFFVDDYVTRTIPVNVEIAGNVPGGYYASEPEITPNVVYISGARVDVQKVASAVCRVNLSGLSTGYNKSVEVELFDSEGGLIDNTLFAGSIPSVIVDLKVMARKSVSVDARGSVLGQDDLAPGYEITDIWAVPESVDIAGESLAIGGIDKVQLISYSVSGATGDIVVLLDYKPIEGVSILSTGKAQIYITIRQITQTKEFGNVEIARKNISPDLVAELDISAVDVTVIVGIVKLSALDKSEIMPYVDLEGLVPGVYILGIQFEIPEGFTEDNFTPSQDTVTVKIKNAP